jgi:hypothetical protein
MAAIPDLKSQPHKNWFGLDLTCNDAIQNVIWDPESYNFLMDHELAHAYITKMDTQATATKLYSNFVLPSYLGNAANRRHALLRRGIIAPLVAERAVGAQLPRHNMFREIAAKLYTHEIVVAGTAAREELRAKQKEFVDQKRLEITLLQERQFLLNQLPALPAEQGAVQPAQPVTGVPLTLPQEQDIVRPPLAVSIISGDPEGLPPDLRNSGSPIIYTSTAAVGVTKVIADVGVLPRQTTVFILRIPVAVSASGDERQYDGLVLLKHGDWAFKYDHMRDVAGLVANDRFATPAETAAFFAQRDVFDTATEEPRFTTYVFEKYSVDELMMLIE